MFHDLPEILTKDIVSPVKYSVEGLENIIKEFENNQVEERILPLLPESWHFEMKSFIQNEFVNRIVKNDEVKVVDNIDKNEVDAIDGKLVEICDKLSAYIYIPILFDSFFKFSTSMSTGAIIENSIHEINHMNQNILYYRGNDKKLFLTPKREDIKGEDGGENLENILFGRKIESLKILESFYILNENNWEQSLDDFKKNFKNLYDNSVNYSEKIKYVKNNNEDIIFKKFFLLIQDYKEEDFKKVELYSITTKKKLVCMKLKFIYQKKIAN